VLAPGNAGSPLFNRCGQVIGVFSPVAVPSQPAESLPENISLATKTGHIYPVLKTQLSMAPRDSCEAGEKSGLMDALRDSVVLVITR
jgi:hypothetical protein